MRRMLAVERAVLAQFNTLRFLLFVLGAVVIDTLAFSAL